MYTCSGPSRSIKSWKPLPPSFFASDAVMAQRQNFAVTEKVTVGGLKIKIGRCASTLAPYSLSRSIVVPVKGTCLPVESN